MSEAHSKSEYKRRSAMGDTSVTPPTPKPMAWIDPEFNPGAPYGKVTSPVTTYEVRDWLPLYTSPRAVWRPTATAPKDGTRILAVVEGCVRFVAWGKTSHVPLYGFCLADQGVEDFDICDPTGWMPVPAVDSK